MAKRMMMVLSATCLLSHPVFAQGIPSQNTQALEVQKMMQARQAARANAAMALYNSPLIKEKIEKFLQSMFEMGLLYKMLEQPNMVSVDNGIVIAYGNTLRKYDKDLHMVKEVNLDVDTEGMQEVAGKFAQKYSNQFMDLLGSLTPGQGGQGPAVQISAAPSSPRPADGYNNEREKKIQQEINQMQ